MREYGYCRISTSKQNIERQIRNIRSAYPGALIIYEHYTGTTSERPEWQKLMKVIKPGDRIIFDSVSRMSRNAEDGITAYEDFFNRGIDLVFLKEPHINTEVYRRTVSEEIALTGNEIADEYIRTTNRVLMMLARQQIRIAFEQSEKEVADLHQRTREGIETARLNGKQIGRPGGVNYETKKSVSVKRVIQRHAKDFGGDMSDAEILRLTGISRNTYYKYKNELKNSDL